MSVFVMVRRQLLIIGIGLCQIKWSDRRTLSQAKNAKLFAKFMWPMARMSLNKFKIWAEFYMAHLIIHLV